MREMNINIKTADFRGEATNNIIAVPRKRCVCDREGEAPEDEVFSLYPVIYVRATLPSEEILG